MAFCDGQYRVVWTKRGTACWWTLLLAPRPIGPRHPPALCKGPCGSKTRGLFSEGPHPSRVCSPHTGRLGQPTKLLQSALCGCLQGGLRICGWGGGAPRRGVAPSSPFCRRHPLFAPVGGECPPPFPSVGVFTQTFRGAHNRTLSSSQMQLQMSVNILGTE